MASHDEATTQQAATRRRLVLAVLCAAPFVLVLDTTIVTVALPSIGRDLGFSTATLHWVLASYALVFGGLLLGGRLGDLFGHRRLFLAGAVFAAASTAGGLAVAPWMLLAARVLQGVEAAALMPAALALVTSVFPARHPGNRQALDLPGAVTVTAALAAPLYALSQARAAGWTAPVTLGPLVVGVALLAAFVAVEHRARAPLVPLATFRVRPVTVANAAILLESATTAYAFVLTLYFQQVLELSPLATGLYFLPLMIAAAVAAPVAGRLIDTLGGLRPTMLQAMVVQAAGLLLMALTLAGRGIASVIAGTVVWATGKVFADVAGTITATSGLAEDRKGTGRWAAEHLPATERRLRPRGDRGRGGRPHHALGGAAAGSQALVEALQWGLLACVAFVALALTIVLAGLRHWHRSQETAP